MAGIYIHVPFCYQRCHYCDFYSTLRLDDRAIFVSALIREIESRKNYLEDKNIDTIYFGGGTPSVLSHENITDIIEKISSVFTLADNTEITLEANPDDLSKGYLEKLSKTKVNRLSIGIQSFNDTDLKNLNRRHDARQARDAVFHARNYGFLNMSIDLIYGLPEQTEGEWKKNLEIASSLDVEHISAYHLTYERGTKFYRWLKEGLLKELNENLSLDLFRIAVQMLENQGYEHYEISNFARNQKYSRHNTKYWFGEQYLGLGPSAHSFNGREREWNITDLDKWMSNGKDDGKDDGEGDSKEDGWRDKRGDSKGDIEEDSRGDIGEDIGGDIGEDSRGDKRGDDGKRRSEFIDIETARNEMIMTRLRTMWGISESEYIDKFGNQSWENLLKMASPFINQGLMEIKENHLLISQKGKFLSDGIIAELFIIP